MIEGQIAVVVDGEAVLMWQPITASDVLRLGGLSGEGIVIRTDGGRASRFAPGTPVTFDADAVRPVFRTFRGAAHRLWVDGLRWDWGAPLIRVAEVRAIGGIAADVSVRLDGDVGHLSPMVLIDLTTEPPPRLVTQHSIPAGSSDDARRDELCGTSPGPRGAAPASSGLAVPTASTVSSGARGR